MKCSCPAFIDDGNRTTRPSYGTTPHDCIVMGARCPKIELEFTY